MKRISLWLTTAALFLGTTISRAEDMGVKVSDGKDSSVFSFASTPTVTFEEGILYVTSSEGSVEYPMTSTVSFEFIDLSGVEEVIQDAVRINLTNSEVTLTGLKPSDLVQIVQTDGKIILAGKADETGAFSVSASTLPHTPLIFIAGKRSFKIIIK